MNDDLVVMPIDPNEAETLMYVFQVTEEIEGTRFNTGIAAMMEFINAAYKVILHLQSSYLFNNCSTYLFNNGNGLGCL